MDPKDQSFTAKVHPHLHADTGPITAYAIGIRFESALGQCNIPQLVSAVTSSASANTFPPTNSIDNNASTKWMSTNSLNPFIQLDLGALKSVCRVDVSWVGGNKCKFRIEVSTDNLNWGTGPVNSGQSTGNTTSPESYTFVPNQARFVKITITESTPGAAASIAQISDIKVFSNV